MITEKRRVELKELFIKHPDGNWKDGLTQEEKVMVLHLELAYYIGKQHVVSLIIQNICEQLTQDKKQPLEADFQEDLQTLGKHYMNELNNISSMTVETNQFTQMDWMFYGLQAVYESFPIYMLSDVYDLMATLYGQEAIDQFQKMQRRKFHRIET